MSERESTREQNVLSTLRATANSYIWEPWFAQVNGNLGVSAVRSSSANNTDSSTTRGLVLTGGGQLNVLPISPFPFEAHFDRQDSRVSNELVSVEEYSGHRFGFTQQYNRSNGSVMLGWDRAAQNAELSGRDQQDMWRLSGSYGIDKHRFSLNGDRSRNTRIRTGESVTSNNLTVQHSYTPAAMFSFENMGNVSRSGFKIGDSEHHTDLAQLSTLAFWRSSARPLTLSSGVRLLTMESESDNGGTGGSTGMRARNANLNLGLSYDLTQALHFNASANANMTEANGNRTTGANQTAALNYSPVSRKIGEFNYNWGLGGTASNSTNSDGAKASQAGVQLHQMLSRSVNVGEGSSLSFDMNQAFSASKAFSLSGDMPDFNRQISHGAGVSWTQSKGGGSAMVRLSVSDSRALEGSENYFQLINLQASSNLLTSGYTSWNGNLTLQATRQGEGNRNVPSTNVEGSGTAANSFSNRDEFVTSSSGGVTYQNSRLFGVRRLLFSSEVRMNSNTLMPLFNGPLDQEMAAWQNRLEYSIGRTQLRVNTMWSRTKQPTSSSVGGVTSVGGISRTNKAIMFSARRSFGD